MLCNMKPTLLFAALTLALSTSTTFAKSELETLRSLCAEQERQIRLLEEENMNLREGREVPGSSIKNASKPAPAPLAKVDAPAGSDTVYVVKPGDSLGKIANKVGTSEKQLAKTNGLKPAAIIHPGQKLKVPGASVAASTPAAVPVQSGSGVKSHTVRQGETFYSISKKHGISTASLSSANPTVKAAALRPGQVLKLGGSSPSTALLSASTTQIKASTTPEKTPAPVAKSPEVRPATPAVAPAPSAPDETVEEMPAAAQAAVEEEVAQTPTTNKFRAVTIDGEMTYGEFATKHGTDAERLNALNGLDLTSATVLAKGSELYVPARP